MKCRACKTPDPMKRINHFSRGLCKQCYGHQRKCGNLVDFERLYRPADELLAEWDELRRDGYTREHAAARIGVSKAALSKAIWRASKKSAA